MVYPSNLEQYFLCLLLFLSEACTNLLTSEQGYIFCNVKLSTVTLQTRILTQAHHHVTELGNELHCTQPETTMLEKTWSKNKNAREFLVLFK